MEVSSRLSIDWNCCIQMSLRICLYAGAAQRRTTLLVCPTQTCVFTTKVRYSQWFWHFRRLDLIQLIFLLRTNLQGVGKSHNDAASVRTTCHIPSSCGLYYFEVRIISKGRDGYMGIGLTASSASNFKMNRLPGNFFISFLDILCFPYQLDMTRRLTVFNAMQFFVF